MVGGCLFFLPLVGGENEAAATGRDILRNNVRRTNERRRLPKNYEEVDRDPTIRPIALKL